MTAKGKDVSKKEYAKVLTIIYEISTAKKKSNSLLKILETIEDNQLDLLITAAIGCIEERVRYTKSTENYIIRSSDTKYKELIEYCETVKNSTKPTWQVIAENNGWRPPRTSPLSLVPKNT